MVRGRMTQEWADEHEYEGIGEEDSYYYSPKPGRCQNPHDGHYPIYHRYILRHIESGEVVEIGSHCHQRWRKLRGWDTDAWWDILEEERELAARKRPGERLSAAEDRKLRKRAYIKWIIKKAKEGVIKLDQILMPLGNFRTLEEAHNWAKERGGFCDSTFTKTRKKIHCPKCGRYYKDNFDEKFCLDCGTFLQLIDIEGETFWDVYVNPYYEEGQYEKM